MVSVAILGPSGMLGSALVNAFPEAVTFGRTGADEHLDAECPTDMGRLHDFDYVINCIGIIKPRLTDVAQAIKVNALFPHLLPRDTIQIATDCVFYGDRPFAMAYDERSPHDCRDEYGKTKSLGEADHLVNIRCSIIGHEPGPTKYSLLEWFLLNASSAKGFTNHIWNGVTTNAFASVCRGIVDSGERLPTGIHHLVPDDIVSKAELLQIISDAYELGVEVPSLECDDSVNRTLSTLDFEFSNHLWNLAGYDAAPTIAKLVSDMRNA